MRPLHNKVLVERVENEKQTQSGIVLTRMDGPEYAKVLAIGPDVKEVTIGDVVLLDWNKASKAGDNYIIVEDFIVLIYEE